MLLEYDWKQLKSDISPEQAFYIILLLIFWETVRAKQGKGEEISFCRENVAAAVRSVPDYDFKESMLQISERVAWEFLEQGKNAEDVKVLMSWLHRHLRQAQKAGSLRQSSLLLQHELCVLAEREGLFTTTPDGIKALLGALFEGVHFSDMLDMCSGMSYAGHELWERLAAGNAETFYTGEEIEPVFCSIARAWLYLSGEKRCKVIWRNILEPVTGGVAEQYDFITADLPRGTNRPLVCDDTDVRIKGFRNKKIYADWIFIEDMLGRLRQGGYGSALVTTGGLIRENEKQLRQQVIENDWLEAVITLPANLYANVHTTTELLIFHKGKPVERQNRILFIDISRFYCRQSRGAWELSIEGINAAREAFREFRQLDGISVIRERDELNRETVSWKPLSYLTQTDTGARTLKLEQAASIVRGAQLKPDEIRVSEGGVKFINVKDIQNERILYESAENVDETRLIEKPQFRIREDDILLTSKGTVIKLAIAGEPQMVSYISENITILRINRQMYHPYVLYDYLQSEEGRRALEGIQSGTTIRILSNANLKKLDIPAYPTDVMEKVGEELRRNRMEFDRQQRELTARFLAQKQKLEQELKNGLKKEARQDGENISESQHEK